MGTKNNISVHGFVAPGFELVKNEFIRNFSERGEVGAAFSVYINNEAVVDLWGGYRNRQTRTEWEKDTLVQVFSATKGFAALALSLAHSRGYINYDEKVCSYWPEFAQNGKDKITVRQLLAHQAGLSPLNELQIDMLEDLDTPRLSNSLAASKPAWEVGKIQGYHAWTIGTLIGELIKRTDPKHRTLKDFFQEEIAEPLKAEFYIGLPKDISEEKITTIEGINHPIQLLKGMTKLPIKMLLGFLNTKSLVARSLVDPKKFVANDNFNHRPILSIEFPSGNGVGQVRAMAKIYGAFASGAKTLGLREETINELRKRATPPTSGYYDHVNCINIAYSLGFWKHFSDMKFGRSESSFGHPGAGGSFCFADPDEKLGYAYAMNKHGFGMANEPRELALRKALYSCL
ncbi:EstA family serine hydrolase [Bacillus thuringiensis]|uniref:serine hydrolase domain-containing protein n=1 Tax=Bacillus cereus group TaxID=86661 RepID=UPI000BECBBD0|nr:MULTISPECIES: serine hydrolase domain-containing protein [Bacillus cereus group]PEB13081.1 EstA family serine hydrolase [Bacillus thuringiensis]PGQ33467.1 EstA family serine hydrolase [Bacillus thuringiensis]PHB27385.1 EstA family serine hydrolase [Bacillus pseudomycoides]